MRRVALGLSALVWLSSSIVGHGEVSRGGSAVAPAASRFLSRPEEPIQTYRALRRIEASNHRFDLHGWLEAVTELTSAGEFRYQVLREGGSEYIRSRVLRPLLENEEKLVATRDTSRGALTAQNYELHGAQAAEPGVVKIFVKPKRRDVLLVDGAAFVTERDADLLRVEGRLAKNPSFWTKRVDVVRRYGRIGGRRVPTRLDSVAQIRFAGTAMLSMSWDYEMIDGASVIAASASGGAPQARAGTP